MKTCKHCNIIVGGEKKHCPLCQNPLTGQPSEGIWPKSYKLKTASVLWKLFVFIVIAGCVVSAFTDYGLLVNEHSHFSLLVGELSAIVLYGTWTFMKSHRSVPRMIFRGTVLVALMLGCIGVYTNKILVMVDTVIPWIFLIALTANFVFCFIDAGFTEDSFLCIILNILDCFIPSIVVKIRGGMIPFMWKIALLLAIVTLIGIIIFKGRTLSIELKKRLNI